MKCQFCGQQHIMSVLAKCNDCFRIEKNEKLYNYIPGEIGKVDYIEFSYCTVCGKIQEKD